MRQMIVALLAFGLLAVAQAEEQQQPSTDELIKAIMAGKDRDGELSAEVVDRTLGPLLEVLEHNGPQSFAELRELDGLLKRYRAELRLRLIRIGLPDIDRRLLDEYMISNPAQVTLLLAAPVDERLRVLDELPLTRDSAIGVLFVALTEDDELAIVNRAFERAHELHDAVVGRNLSRKLGVWLDRVEDDSYRPEETPYRLLYAQFANRAAETLRLCATPDSAAALRRGLKLQRNIQLPIGAEGYTAFVLALGAIRDIESVDLLREALRDDRVNWNRFVELPVVGDDEAAQPKRVLIMQQVGDAALLALLRVYGLPTEGVSLVYQKEGDWTTGGFVKREQAITATKAFEAWYAANAQRPANEREPLSKYLPVEIAE